MTDGMNCFMISVEVYINCFTNGGDSLNSSTYIAIIIMWIIIIYVLLRNRKAVIARQIIKKRKTEGNTEMKELAKRFIGKECVITSFDGNRQYEGVIKEVTDGAILVEKGGVPQAINLDFIIRIREYPKNKKGKKSAILD